MYQDLAKELFQVVLRGTPPHPRAPMESVELTVHHHGDAIGVHMARNPEGATCIDRLTIGGAADDAGLLVGDELVSICRTSVTSPQHAGHIIAQNGMSDIPFSVRREAGIRVLRMHKESAAQSVGVTMGTDTSSHATYVQVVREGGCAAAAGLRVGDIVVSVNGITIENYNHAVGLLRASVGPTRVTVKRAGGVEATPGSGAVANSVGASVGRTREQLLRDSDEAWAAARATEARVEELEAQLVEWRLEDETVERMPIEQLVRLGEELAEKQKRVMTAIDQKRVSKLSGECTICMERPKDTVFGCGHRTCEVCAAKIAKCHYCRVPVTLRIRVYD